MKGGLIGGRCDAWMVLNRWAHSESAGSAASGTRSPNGRPTCESTEWRARRGTPQRRDSWGVLVVLCEVAQIDLKSHLSGIQRNACSSQRRSLEPRVVDDRKPRPHKALLGARYVAVAPLGTLFRDDGRWWQSACPAAARQGRPRSRPKKVTGGPAARAPAKPVACERVHHVRLRTWR
jgi:hypothetical protein